MVFWRLLTLHYFALLCRGSPYMESTQCYGNPAANATYNTSGNLSEQSADDSICFKKKWRTESFNGFTIQISASETIEERYRGYPSILQSDLSIQKGNACNLQLSVPPTIKEQIRGDNMTFEVTVFDTRHLPVKTHQRYVVRRVVDVTVIGETVRNMSDPFYMRYCISMDELLPTLGVVNPVNITSWLDSQKRSIACVWWDNSTRSWINDGYEVGVHHFDDVFVFECASNHMTSFSVIMTGSDELDPYISPTNTTALVAITLFGVGLSILSLLLSILMFIFDRSHHRTLNHKVLFQLNLALVLYFSLFLVVTSGSVYSNTLACTITGALYHYTALSTFCWMIVEAVRLYLSIVQVFNTYISRFLLKAGLFAWGFPAVIPSILLIIDQGNLQIYRHASKLCMVHGLAQYVGYFLPISLMLIFNLTVLCLCIRALMKSTVLKEKRTLRRKFKFMMMSGISLMVLLGGSNILGLPLLILTKPMESSCQLVQLERPSSNLQSIITCPNPSQGKVTAYLIISYIYIIFNTSQGFFIFLIHFLRPTIRRTRPLKKIKSMWLSKSWKNLGQTSDVNSTKSSTRFNSTTSVL